MTNSTEIKFASLFETFKEATKEENMFGHIDLTVDGMKVDVKGMKKLNRSDASVNPDIHWIEFQNVRGNKGWMYGEADYIAFEIPNEFILIERELLLDWCRKVIVDKKPKPKKELYKLYNRPGRKDIISLVLVEDLLKLPHKKISYVDKA